MYLKGYAEGSTNSLEDILEEFPFYLAKKKKKWPWAGAMGTFQPQKCKLILLPNLRGKVKFQIPLWIARNFLENGFFFFPIICPSSPTSLQLSFSSYPFFSKKFTRFLLFPFYHNTLFLPETKIIRKNPICSHRIRFTKVPWTRRPNSSPRSRSENYFSKHLFILSMITRFQFTNSRVSCIFFSFFLFGRISSFFHQITFPSCHVIFALMWVVFWFYLAKFEPFLMKGAGMGFWEVHLGKNLQWAFF